MCLDHGIKTGFINVLRNILIFIILLHMHIMYNRFIVLKTPVSTSRLILCSIKIFLSGILKYFSTFVKHSDTFIYSFILCEDPLIDVKISEITCTLMVIMCKDVRLYFTYVILYFFRLKKKKAANDNLIIHCSYTLRSFVIILNVCITT